MKLNAIQNERYENQRQIFFQCPKWWSLSYSWSSLYSQKMFLFTWRMMGSSVVVTLWKIRLIRFNRFSFFVVTRSYDLSYTSIAPQRILLKWIYSIDQRIYWQWPKHNLLHTFRLGLSQPWFLCWCLHSLHSHLTGSVFFPSHTRLVS